MVAAPECSKTPPPGYVSLEPEIPGCVEENIQIYNKPVKKMSTYLYIDMGNKKKEKMNFVKRENIPECSTPPPASVSLDSEIPGCVEENIQIYSKPVKKTSTYLYIDMGDEKKEKMNFVKRENIKRRILNRLNRKMNNKKKKADVNAHKMESDLAFDDTIQILNDTVENGTPVSQTQLTDLMDCTDTQADVNVEQQQQVQPREDSESEEPKVLPCADVAILNQKQSKKSEIPTKIRPKSPENLVKKPIFKKSNIPVRVIQVKSKTPEELLKGTNSKKSKIPLKVFQNRPKTPEMSLKETDEKKFEIPIRSRPSSPIAEMILNDIDSNKSALPVQIQCPEKLLEESQLPVIVKESDSTVTMAALVEVKVSRLPKKMRRLFKKFRRSDGKKSKKNDSKAKKVRFSLPIDDIYKKALSGSNGMKSRLPMPIRVTHPGQIYPPPSRIPLAFSRFPNPAKVRKTTLLKRVKEALKKQVAKINWKPKLEFPNMESFFKRIRGSNKVMPIYA